MDVHCGGHGTAAELFRRGVVRCARAHGLSVHERDRHARMPRSIRRPLQKPEVDQHGLAVRAPEDVLRLDVAMDESASVQKTDGRTDLLQKRGDVAVPLRQSPRVEEFHHEERTPLRLAGGQKLREERGDVVREERRLAEEPLPRRPLAFRVRLRQQDLQRGNLSRPPLHDAVDLAASATAKKRRRAPPLEDGSGRDAPRHWNGRMRRKEVRKLIRVRRPHRPRTPTPSHAYADCAAPDSESGPPRSASGRTPPQPPRASRR